MKIDANALFSKFVWLLITGAICFGAKKVNDIDDKFEKMRVEITQLNITMTTVVVEGGTVKEITRDHEQRLRVLEGKSHQPVERK